jgi:hypothetical protein
MKVFFETALKDPDPLVMGFVADWSDFVRRIASKSQANQVTYHREEADFVIRGFSNVLSLRSLLVLLARSDLKDFVWDWHDRPVGRLSGFYCSLDVRMFDPRRHRSISYPLQYNQEVKHFPLTDAEYNFGFIGGLTAGVRARMVDALEPRSEQDHSFFRVRGADWSKYYARDQSEMDSQREYGDFLRKTKFILCPRGMGLSSYRLFETMQAGRVPVIISDRFVLPSGPDWDSCSIRVSERDITSIPDIVAKYLDKWPEMAQKSRQAWENYFSEDVILDSLVKQMIELRELAPKFSVGEQLRFHCHLVIQCADEYLRPLAGKLRSMVNSMK